MSTIGKWFVSRIYRRILREMLNSALITQGSLRKSCSLAGGFVPTRSNRGGRARRYLVVIRVLAFVSSGVMISIKSMDMHIGHESSVGVCIAKRSRIYRIESAAMVSVMFVLLTIGGAPVGLVLVFAATRSEMALLHALLVS